MGEPVVEEGAELAVPRGPSFLLAAPAAAALPASSAPDPSGAAEVAAASANLDLDVAVKRFVVVAQRKTVARATVTACDRAEGGRRRSARP